MLEVYKPVPSEGFEFCHPEREEDFEALKTALNGAPRSAAWKSPPMRVLHEDQGKRLAVSDSPWLGSHALVFRRPALTGELETLLRAHGELLPLECSQADLVVFNATRLVDALDESASKLTRFPDGRIMMVSRHAFRSEVVSGFDLFKISQLRVSPTFVSGRFVQAWRALGLKGLEFEKLWSG